MTAHEALVHHHHTARACVVEIRKSRPESTGFSAFENTRGRRRRSATPCARRPCRDAEEVCPDGAAQRHVRRRHRGRHARHEAGSLASAAPGTRFSVRPGARRRTIHERNHERAVGLEAQFDRREVPERLHEEQRRKDDYERQRDLRDDEPALESRAMAIDGRPSRIWRMTVLGSTSDTRSAGSSPKKTAVDCRGGDDERHQRASCRRVSARRFAGRCPKQHDQRARRKERNRRPARRRRRRRAGSRSASATRGGRATRQSPRAWPLPARGRWRARA